MVQHPEHLLKTCETATPISFQNIVFLESSVLPPSPLCCPKSLRRPVTKSEDTNLFVISKRASASATCSLGFCTEMSYPKKERVKSKP